jgi:HlyD family type I secretion membrane fusion protein
MTTEITLRSQFDIDQPTQWLLDFESPTSAVIAAPVQRRARGVLWTVSSLVAATTAALGLVPVDKVVTAKGRLVPLKSMEVVQPLETAVVRAINVREGQLVHAGEVLALLDPTFASADTGALEASVTSLQAEVDRLHAEAAGEPYRAVVTNNDTVLQEALYAQHAAEYRYRIENYRQKIDSLAASLAKAKGEVQGYKQRLEVATVLEAKRTELERLKVGSQINRLAATDQRLQISTSLADAIAQEQSSERDLGAMVAERGGYVSKWRGQADQDLNDASRKLSDAQENLRKAKLRHQLTELRAGQDAVVQTVAKVSAGSVLQSGDQLITLVPTDTTLEVEAKIAGSDSGWVHPGETTTIKFDTFPYVKYGTAEGKVRTVSPDSFTAAGTANQRGAVVNDQGQQLEPYYLGRITIDKLDLRGLPEGFHLQLGMPVTVDVKVGEQTILDSIFSRVMPVLSEGMREP